MKNVIGLLGLDANGTLYTPNGQRIGRVPGAHCIQAAWNRYVAYLQLRP